MFQRDSTQMSLHRLKAQTFFSKAKSSEVFLTEKKVLFEEEELMLQIKLRDLLRKVKAQGLLHKEKAQGGTLYKDSSQMSENVFRDEKLRGFLNGETGLVRGERERTQKHLLLKKKQRNLHYKEKSSEIFFIKKKLRGLLHKGRSRISYYYILHRKEGSEAPEELTEKKTQKTEKAQISSSSEKVSQKAQKYPYQEIAENYFSQKKDLQVVFTLEKHICHFYGRIES